MPGFGEPSNNNRVANLWKSLAPILRIVRKCTIAQRPPDVKYYWVTYVHTSLAVPCPVFR